MNRLTYWNDKSKGSALPMTIPDSMGEVVSLEDICAKLAAYEDAEVDPTTRDRCCMCPGAICTGIPGTPHPEPSPCRLTGGDVT